MEWIKDTKSQWVAEHHDDPDLQIYLHFYRGDDLVAIAQCPMDRDVALQAAHVAAMGLAADCMSIGFESYHTTLENSPLTGKPWMPKEMQFVSETYPLRTEWAAPCLTVTMHERGGASTLHSQPYRIVKDQVEWIGEVKEISSENDGEGAGGFMFDAMQHAMSLPTIDESLAKAAESDDMAALVSGLITDEEARRFHMDMATLKALNERELVISVALVAMAGTVREQMIKERLGTDAEV